MKKTITKTVWTCDRCFGPTGTRDGGGMSSWEDVEDPEGRLKKGQLVRWNHAEPGRCDMRIIRLCAPMGLYNRPVRENDSPFMKAAAKETGGTLPCDANDPDAVYEPERLMVYFRYVGGGETTGRAVDMVVIDDARSQ